MKAERFIYYAMPFFFIGGAYLAEKLLAFASDAVARTRFGDFMVLKIGVLAFVGLPFIVSNPAFRTTADMVRGRPAQTVEGNLTYWSAYPSNWEAATGILQPIADQSSIVVTSQGLHLLFFLGSYDVELLASASEYVGDEFALDPRMGRPTISTGESFELIRNCYESGLVVIHDIAWRHRNFVPPDAADAIERTN